jgi:hypothetical protein
MIDIYLTLYVVFYLYYTSRSTQLTIVVRVGTHVKRVKRAHILHVLKGNAGRSGGFSGRVRAE